MVMILHFTSLERGGHLTWGVCRQDLRNSIAKGSIVVFFSFTPLARGELLYRLCAVETVADKLDHRAVHRDRAFLTLPWVVSEHAHRTGDWWLALRRE